MGGIFKKIGNQLEKLGNKVTGDTFKPPEMPEMPEPPPSVDFEKRAQLSAEAKRRERLRAGSASTQLTGGQMSSASVGTKQLLGR